MSVEQLLKYKGSSPCPEDIDEYWNSALTEMNSVNHNAEFIKKEYPSKLAHMYHEDLKGSHDRIFEFLSDI